MAPLASIREVELELEQRRETRVARALVAERGRDVTKVMWKPRELLESESERMDADGVGARAGRGETRARGGRGGFHSASRSGTTR